MARLSRADLDAVLACVAEFGAAASRRERASYRRLAAALTELESVRAAPAADGKLTPRENEILDLVACGETNAAIAERLRISPGTVRKHLEHVYVKLDVGSRTAALAETGRSSAAAPSPHP